MSNHHQQNIEDIAAALRSGPLVALLPGVHPLAPLGIPLPCTVPPIKASSGYTAFFSLALLGLRYHFRVMLSLVVALVFARFCDISEAMSRFSHFQRIVYPFLILVFIFVTPLLICTVRLVCDRFIHSNIDGRSTAKREPNWLLIASSPIKKGRHRCARAADFSPLLS